ncbi:MAG: Ig-like domain-containing protein, partial [Pseudomonadota bacterium]
FTARPVSVSTRTVSAITITATDAAGNVDTITDTVRVDTETGLAVNPNQTADDIINAAEHASGVTLAGSADAGSTVTVVLQGVTRQATADANGDWTVNFTAAELPEGTYTATATITATDPAGNSETVTETFAVDTEIADPSVTSATMTGSGLRRFGTDDTIDSYSVNALDPSGNVTTPAATVDQDPTFGTEFTFTTPIPDGTNLVVTRTDTAGNSASTLVVNEDNATTASTIGNSGIGQFDISSLNLEYNGDSSLVLTEAQIKALSDSSDTLTIRGKSDDTVTVTGAVDTGNTQVIDGETYNVYTIGSDGATLVIDEDVNVII